MISENSEKSVIQLDLKGLSCPMPILKTKQALMRAEKGDRLEVYATDPHAEIDFKAYLARTEHQLLSLEKRDDLFIFLIEKC